MNKSGIKKAACAVLAASLLWVSSLCRVLAKPQPPEFPNFDLDKPVVRIEPSGNGIVYNVCFIVNNETIGEPYAALEGYGLGEKQWPLDPRREEYTFAGWYDNEERTGNPYSADTPIYRDTDLYAKWKYSGSGGCWPRPGRGEIIGIEKGAILSAGLKVSFIAGGYNMNLSAPKDQRFRWIPVMFRVPDAESGVFPNKAPYLATFTISAQGEYGLYITYKEEVFDGVNWQETGQVHEVDEVSFSVRQ